MYIAYGLMRQVMSHKRGHHNLSTSWAHLGGAEGLLAQWFKGAIYVDDAKVHIEEANLDPLRPRPIVALNFERGIFGEVRFLP